MPKSAKKAFPDIPPYRPPEELPLISSHTIAVSAPRLGETKDEHDKSTQAIETICNKLG